MNMFNYKKQFVQNLKDTTEYWLNFQDEGKERVLDGALFSICAFIDGCCLSGNTYYFIDGETNEELNGDINLHEMLNTTGENILIDDLKTIRDYWKIVPDLSIKESLDGMVAQICQYFAGELELNNYSQLGVVEEVDEDNFVKWDCKNLHEIYTKL